MAHSRRPSYRAERRRSQRDGGIAVTMYLKEQREKKPRFEKRIAKALVDPFKTRKPRRKPRRK